MSETSEFERGLADLIAARKRATELATAAFLAAWDAAGIIDPFVVVHTPVEHDESRSITPARDIKIDGNAIDVTEGTSIRDLPEAHGEPLYRALEYVPFTALWAAAITNQVEDRKYGGWRHYIAIDALRAWQQANR